VNTVSAETRSRFPASRVLSAIVAFVGTSLAIWVGLPLLIPVYLILSFIAIQEYSQMMSLRGIPIRKRSLWLATLLTLPAALPLGYPGMVELAAGVSWRELLLGVFALYLVTLELIRPNRNSLHCIVFSLFGYFYIPWLFSYLITLRFTPDPVLGIWYLALPVLAIVGSDVGAYLVGTLLGRRKLAPLISPNKTVEGSIGGAVLAIAFVLTAQYFLQRADLLVNVGNLALFSAVVAFGAQLGDLFESMLKRWIGVKDAGVFLPGHGGVLDRIDSHLFALPLAYLFLSLFVFN
jgi:phosphatidate cytidylyltransferase